MSEFLKNIAFTLGLFSLSLAWGPQFIRPKLVSAATDAGKVTTASDSHPRAGAKLGRLA